MAIYHLSCGFVSRSSGRSAVQAAAYISGERLVEERRGLVANYTNRASDVIAVETLFSEGVLNALKAKYGDAFKGSDIWNILENFEDNYANGFFKNEEAKLKFLNSAQVAQTLVVALPKELSVESSIELFKNFANKRFVSRGLAVQLAVHDDEGNPHGHLIISRRSIDENGMISSKKDREIVSRSELIYTRKLWAEMANNMLEREGFDERITHKSFIDLGIDLEPSKHRGWFSDKLIQMNLPSRIVIENQSIYDKNKAKVIADPSIILNELTSFKATFNQMDLYKLLGRRLGDNDKVIASTFEAALGQSILVGDGVDGMPRYTSKSYEDMESHALNTLEILQNSSFKVPVDNRLVDQLLSFKYAFFNESQCAAVKGITRTYLNGANLVSSQFDSIIGRAGAGKTTTLKAVAELYKESGAVVVGTSLAALAAENLANDASIACRTIDSYLSVWSRYDEAKEKFLSFGSVMNEGILKQQTWYRDLVNLEKFQLTDKHVLIVDEAGMVGTKKWCKLLDYANSSGAKIIAVGDDNQFKAIEAGDFFRSLSADTPFVLNEIKRQKVEWMREASTQLSNGNVMEGLSLYSKHDKVKGVKDDQFVKSIAIDYLNQAKDVSQKGVILCFENALCNKLNDEVRTQLKAKGHLAKDDILTINERGFGVGDKIICLKNVSITDGVNDHKINNGMRGEIVRVQNDYIKFKTENELITINFRKYDAINHAYAITTHKSQGQTVDFTVVAASKRMDAQALYVALTRHEHNTTLFYNLKEFKDFKALSIALARFDNKDLVSDYTISAANQPAFLRVREYKDLTVDMASILRAKTDIDWQMYNELKAKRTGVGKLIVENFKDHRLYVNQANLTKESIAVACGLKARPLGLEEKIARDTVTRYGVVSEDFRKVLNIMNNKNIPTDAPYNLHTRVQNLHKKIKNERFVLADTMMQNPGFYKEFIHNSYKQTGLNMAGITKVYEQGLPKNKDPDDVAGYITPSYSKLERLHITNPKISADEIKKQLSLKTSELALQLLGDPISRTSRELRFGKKGSISVHTQGSKQGLYCNFETGVKGGPLVLIGEQLNLDYKESFKWAASWLNLDENHTYQSSTFQKDTGIQSNNTKIWTPIFPAPNNTPDIKTDKYLSYQLRGHHETARFTYKDADGNPLGHVVRLEDDQGNKKTLPLTYCENEKGVKAWRWQGFGGENNSRPIYGLDKLKDSPNAPILIVEGEKACEAARKIFPDHNVITWSGGCGAVAKTDWAPLNDHANPDITIWPDHDKPGIKAANQVGAEILKLDNLTRSNIKIVDLSLDFFTQKLPHKWDLADDLPKELNDKIYKLCIQKAPQIGQQLSNNQFIEDKLQARINELGLQEKVGPVRGPIQNTTIDLYTVIREITPDERRDVVDVNRLDQSIYMALKLQQMNPLMNDYKSRLDFIKLTAMEGQVFAVMENKNLETLPLIANEQLDKVNKRESDLHGSTLQCMDVSFDKNKNLNADDIFDKIHSVSKKAHEQSLDYQKLSLQGKTYLQQSKILGLNERLGKPNFAINDTYKGLLETITDLHSDHKHPKIDMQIQSLYMAQALTNNILRCTPKTGQLNKRVFFPGL